jgi:hypothetical protein
LAREQTRKEGRAVALKSGQAGTITPRDEALLRDLYFCRFLSTEQVAALRFPSFESARVRLYALMRKGWVVNQVHRPNLVLWRLSREGFERQRASLDREKEPTPDFFQGPKVEHYLEANDLYARVAPRLERVLGPYPAWEWKNEGRCIRRYELGGERRAHQPDAEILLPEHLFLFERQSRRARYAASQIREKVAAHALYLRRVPRPETRVELLFACELDREKRAAVEAGEELGVEVAASSLGGIANHLERTAVAVAAGRRRGEGVAGETAEADPHETLTRPTFSPEPRVRGW